LSGCSFDGALDVGAAVVDEGRLNWEVRRDVAVGGGREANAALADFAKEEDRDTLAGSDMSKMDLHDRIPMCSVGGGRL